MPLICFPGIAGSADVFFPQIMHLSSKGYRVISVRIFFSFASLLSRKTPFSDCPLSRPSLKVQHAPYMSFTSLLKGLDLLLDRLKLTKCHMLGEGFGGYIAQCYAQYRPAKVASLVLCNSYCDLAHFVDSSPWTGMLSWMPDVLMKRFLVSDLRYSGPELDLVKAYKFVSANSKKFETDDLCSRLTLQYMQGPLKPKEFPIPDEAITIIDTDDQHAIPDRIRFEVHKYYPGAKEVTLKSGGTFPFLSRSELFNEALEVHLEANTLRISATSPAPAASSSSNGDAALPSSSTSPAPQNTHNTAPEDLPTA